MGKKRFEIGSNLQYLIMYIAMLIFFLLLSVISEAQTVTLPTWLADSLIYETFKGRECNNLQASQAEVIKAQGLELVANGKALKLSGNQTQTLENMVVNLKDQNKLQSERFSNKEKESKKKLRKRGVIIIGQAVIIVLLII